MCVSAYPLAINYYSHKTKSEKPVKQVMLLFSCYTAPLIDIANGCGRSKKVHCKLLSRETKVRLY